MKQANLVSPQQVNIFNLKRKNRMRSREISEGL